MKHGLDGGHALGPHLVVVGNDQDAIHDGDAEQRDEAHGSGYAEIQSRDEQANDAAGDGEGNAEQSEQTVAQRVEKPIEQHQDQNQAHGNDDGEPLLCLLQGFELAGPLETIAVRQSNVLGNARLSLSDRTAEIPLADAEFHGDETLVALVINVGRTGIERYLGKLGQGNVGVGPGRRLISDLEGTNGIDVLPILRSQPHRDIELSIALEKRGRDLAAHGRLDDARDVAGVETIARRGIAIDLDVQVGLTEDAEDAKVGHSLDLSHLREDLVGQPFEGGKVTSDDLDGVGPLHSGEPLLDVVLDILREIEVDTCELPGELRLQLIDQLLLGEASRPFVERLQGRKEFGIVETRRIAAIVWAAMLRDHGDDFRVAEQHLAHLGDVLHARFQRDGWRHGGTYPQVAFFQVGQELGAEAGGENARQHQERQANGDRDLPSRKGQPQDGGIDCAQGAHDARFGLADVFG